MCVSKRLRSQEIREKCLQGDHIWIEPQQGGEFACPIGARVLDVEHGRIRVHDDDNKEYWLEATRRIKIMHASSVQGVEDMISLGDLHESGILRNLLVRYQNRLIYTYTGSILVAVNPYCDLPIYTIDQIRAYRQRRIGELPPHIFAIADNAYAQMRDTKKTQCIIISGESGAGKTESTKLVLQFLAATSGQHSWIEQQILMANPVIEAFGNAKTVRNDNSSRFGKYIDIHFNSAGAIEGARIEQYLLEKSRIVSQARGERNYHIFYCMLAGLSQDERKDLHLTAAGNYFYLTQGKTLSADGRDDRADYAEIKDAMKVLMFKDSDIWSTMRVLAALLHIGNIQYAATTVNNIDTTEIHDNGGAVAAASRLLQIDARALVNALTTRTLVTRNERVVSALTGEQSLDVRDALVKAIYGHLFEWLVNMINTAIYKPKQEQIASRIGVLDIFGFENFSTNSFEQLCINYANEHLQQFFVQHIFKLEQQEYDQEHINWQHIEFIDNQEVLALLSQKPMNVLSLIDEESKFPKGTDQTMLNKLHQQHSRNKLYLKPKSDLSRAFGIEHFAGAVIYDARGFLEKNRDTFSADLIAVIEKSKFTFLTNLFGDMIAETPTRMTGTNVSALTMRKATVGAKFRKSLDELMQQLHQCEPFFVRCIKPNDTKSAMIFERELCCKQLRYSGMMETIRIRKAGYPIRHDFDSFVERYRILGKRIPPAHRVNCRDATAKICATVFGNNADYQLGRTKLFLKDAQQLYLERERDVRLSQHIVTIQKMIRGWCARRCYQRQRQSAITIQKIYRGYAARQRYRQMRLGFARLQAIIRARQLVAHYNRLRYIVIQLQAHCRGILVRRDMRAKWQAGARRAPPRPEDIIRDKLHAQQAAAAAAADGEAVANGRSTREEELDDERLVEQMFGFLPSDGSSDGTDQNHNATPQQSRPGKFEDLQKKASMNEAEMLDSRVIPDRDQDLSSYQFGKFAATYFQGNVTSTWEQKPLRQPLLPHENTGDQIAALAVWITILRFMGDLPEPEGDTSIKDNTPVMARLYSTLGRSYSKRDLQQAQQIADNAEQLYSGNGTLRRSSSASSSSSKGGTVRQKLISMTLRRKSKLNDDMMQQLKSGEINEGYNALLDNRPTSNLEKLHFIIGHGILRPDLRNEIYCQICKQLSANDSKASHARGWILMSLCVGCFAPTDAFVKYLRSFIREYGPSGYDAYCEQRLQRTLINGTRHQPPSYMELQATKSKKALILPVTFMDGTTKTLIADSATTARELCNSLAEKIGLSDRFGFSLYIALYDKVSSLGSGGDHVMDAVSQCEQYAKEQGALERNAPWRLFYRKEIFAPWHSARDDSVSTQLIYQQVVRGIKYGEYRCDKEDDLAMLCAQQYFVEYGGGEVNLQKLQALLPRALPDSTINNKDTIDKARLDKWVQLVLHAHRKAFDTANAPKPQRVKEDVVAYAKYKWPLLFSRFYEAYKYAGPPLPKNEVIIAVNWTGVYVVDDQEQVLLELSYPEITGVVCSKTGRLHAETFTVCTVPGDEYTFQSPNSDDIRELIDYFLEGLRKRSRYLIALCDHRAPNEESEELSYIRGDLLQLESGHHGGECRNNIYVPAECVRTGARGSVASDNVYVLPTSTKPTKDILELFSSTRTDALLASSTLNKENSSALVPYGQPMNGFDTQIFTLEAYAKEHFRERRVTPADGKRRPPVEETELWRHSYEPLQLPLLQKLKGKEEPSIEASATYVAILKYMGDYPSRRQRSGTELTDLIFTSPLKYEIVRDEIYCQLVKQLTFNPHRHSEERGWELLWLTTGLFAPSQSLLKHITTFLRSRHHPIAADCYNRLQNAGQRKYAPHQVEVEAIQHKTTQIFHKVYFPDDTDEAIEVDSSTRARDFCLKIASRLGLKSAEGFSLFVKIADKVISVPENDFFFDFVRQLTEWIRKARPAKDGGVPSFTYQVFFMKKLWTNTTPGKDRVADLIFHYHQELPKYLRGYHLCSRDEAARLAALILKARYENDRAAMQAVQSSQTILDVLPRDMVKMQSTSEWRRAITAAYTSEAASMHADDAKMHFLRAAYQWPTFGSAFFEVKQTSDASLPERLLVAINKNGVNLIDPSNKEIITTYPFTRISNWSSGNTYFHMTVGNLMKGNRLLLETSLGYKMDDLLTSYISLMLANMNARPNTGKTVSQAPML